MWRGANFKIIDNKYNSTFIIIINNNSTLLQVQRITIEMFKTQN